MPALRIDELKRPNSNGQTRKHTEMSSKRGGKLLDVAKRLKLDNPVLLKDWFAIAAMTVTPDLAYWWLSECSGKNRNIISHSVQQIERDIENNIWRRTHQGIAFSEDGVLRDGQHRLYCCVDKLKPIDLLVSVGIDEDGVKATDIHRVRTFRDAMFICGKSMETWVPSMLRRFLCGKSVHVKMGNEELLSHLERHVDMISWMARNMTSRRKNVCVAPVLGAIGRAYYHVDVVRLCEFLNSMVNMEFDGAEDSAAKALFDYLINNPRAEGTEKYLKTQNAIRLFSGRKPTQKIYEAKDELYPIPEVF